MSRIGLPARESTSQAVVVALLLRRMYRARSARVVRIAIAGVRAGAVAVAAALSAWLVMRGGTPTATGSPELPPWFGDSSRTTRLAGRVAGSSSVMTVHLLLDVPDPMLWRWREVRTTQSGEFDFGAVRAGRYRLFADGKGQLTRLVTIDSMRDRADRVELFARELSTLPPSRDTAIHRRFEDYEWDSAYRLSMKPIEPFVVPGLPMSGVVVRADGSPAASVGVQPIECPHGSHDLPHGIDVVATTSAAGGFSFVPYDDHLCGLRVLMGAKTHEVKLAYPNRLPFFVQLPGLGQEQNGIFDPGRRNADDPRGGWLRGHVLHNGVPAADLDIRALVLPQDNMEVFDETRSRSDGSFELFISSKELDTVPFVLLMAGNSLDRLAGARVVRLTPGQTRGDLKLEVGAGMTIAGTLVDERGFPISGVQVGTVRWDPDSWSQPTAVDGHFQLTIHRLGRHRLHAFVSEARELAPAMGHFAPQVDVTAPSGEMSGITLVFSQRERPSTDESVWPGIVDIGAEIRDGIVVAVRDELAAAGLRIGDHVLSAMHSGVALEPWELWRAARVLWGEELTLTVKRGTERLEVSAAGPMFGSTD